MVEKPKFAGTLRRATAVPHAPGHRGMHRVHLAGLALLALCACAPLAAHAAPGMPAPARVQGDAAGMGATDAAADSAAGDSSLAAAPSAEDYLAEVRAAFTPENRRYAQTGVVLQLVGPLYAVLVGLLILFAGWSARMRNAAVKVTRFRYVHTLVFVILYTLLATLLTLPLSWYSGFSVEHQYGLSNQSLSQWSIEQLKGMGIGIAALGVVPLIYLAYGAIRKSKRWWMWLGFGTLPVIVILVLIQPLVIDPVFNKFKPLEDKQLETRVLALAEKTGIPGRHVYQVDKSEQTKKLNAYVNGFGASQRVVFWDTIIKAMDTDELVFVAGHEMGHYVLGHVWKSILFLFALSFILFYLSAKAMGALTRRFGGRWGFTELHDLASLPLLAMTLTVVSFLAQPAMFAFTRFQEHQADMFALEATHLNDAGARAFIKLGSQNKSDPEPSALETWLLWTHPPLIQRVKFMESYRPWEEGRPNRLFHGKHQS